jgi:hypothetical protein
MPIPPATITIFSFHTSIVAMLLDNVEPNLQQMHPDLVMAGPYYSSGTVVMFPVSKYQAVAAS